MPRQGFTTFAAGFVVGGIVALLLSRNLTTITVPDSVGSSAVGRYQIAILPQDGSKVGNTLFLLDTKTGNVWRRAMVYESSDPKNLVERFLHVRDGRESITSTNGPASTQRERQLLGDKKRAGDTWEQFLMNQPATSNKAP